MKWQPPIPAGAFCSPAAIKINTALPLLGWCYDQVQRDGWLILNLHDAAGDMQVPYHTIRKWWSALRTSEFVATIEERGRGGMRIRIADAWIDWRILAARPLEKTVPDPVPISDEPAPIETETVPNMAPITANRERNERETVPNMAPIDRVYKEDQHDQESRERGARKRAVSRAPPQLESLHEGVTAYRRLTGKRTVAPTVATQIAEKITDLPLWEKVITAWCGKYRPENVSGMLDWYEHPEKIHSNGALQSGKHNGRHPDPRDEWQGFTPWDQDKPL